MLKDVIINKEILSLVKKLDIYTKKMVSGPLTGDVKTRRRGSGFEFEQIREYQPGDDVRFIDWKSSARANKLLVRQYLADKNRSIIVFVDSSNSMFFGSDKLTKIDLTREISALLMLSSMHSKDAVGLALFTDNIESFNMPKVGRPYVLKLISELYAFKPKDNQTSLDEVFKYLGQKKLRNTLVCVISDFETNIDKNLVAAAVNKNEVIAIRVLDKREFELPTFGFVNFKDRENQSQNYIELGVEVNNQLKKWHSNQKQLLNSVGVDLLDVEVGRTYLTDLLGFLRNRSLR